MSMLLVMELSMSLRPFKRLTGNSSIHKSDQPNSAQPNKSNKKERREASNLPTNNRSVPTPRIHKEDQPDQNNRNQLAPASLATGLGNTKEVLHLLDSVCNGSTLVGSSVSCNEVLPMWKAELAAKLSNLGTIFIAHEDQITVVRLSVSSK